MMASFSDDFNRADGAVGADWTAIGGTWTIVSNALVESGANGTIYYLYADAAIEEATYSVSVDVGSAGSNVVAMGIALLSEVSGAPSGYCFTAGEDNLVYANEINNGSLGSFTGWSFVEEEVDATPGPVTMRVDVTGTTYEVFVDDVSYGSGTNAEYTPVVVALISARFGGIGSRTFDSFAFTDGEPEPEETITPVYNSGSFMVQLVNDTNCVQGWAIRLVSPPAGLTPIYDPSSIMVALVDENNCVQSWAIRIVAAS